VIKDRNFTLILLCFVFAYSGAALPVAAQTKGEKSGVSLDVIASVAIANPTNEVLTLSVIAPAAFLLTESALIDDEYDDPEGTATGFPKYMSFFSLLSIHPVFTEENSKENSPGSLAPQAPRPPPFP
jgi:hypothetical protein